MFVLLTAFERSRAREFRRSLLFSNRSVAAGRARGGDRGGHPGAPFGEGTTILTASFSPPRRRRNGRRAAPQRRAHRRNLQFVARPRGSGGRGRPGRVEGGEGFLWVRSASKSETRLRSRSVAAHPSTAPGSRSKFGKCGPFQGFGGPPTPGTRRGRQGLSVSPIDFQSGRPAARFRIRTTLKPSRGDGGSPRASRRAARPRKAE